MEPLVAGAAGYLMILFPPSQDMIHIADTKVARRYGDFFIRQIHKSDEVSSQTTCNLSLSIDCSSRRILGLVEEY